MKNMVERSQRDEHEKEREVKKEGKARKGEKHFRQKETWERRD